MSLSDPVRVVIVPSLSSGDVPFEMSAFVPSLERQLREAGIAVVVVDAEREQVELFYF